LARSKRGLRGLYMGQRKDPMKVFQKAARKHASFPQVEQGIQKSEKVAH
jgi:hypothetical protein